MSTTPQQTISCLKCRLLGHKYILTNNVTDYLKEYTCVRCGKEITTNAQGVITPLTPELKEIHQNVSDFVGRRRLNCTDKAI